MSQFCKIVVEGRRGYGKLTKPVSQPRIAQADPARVAADIVEVLGGIEDKMGPTRFADRSQLFRTAHGLYAIAVVINDAGEGHTTKAAIIDGAATIDWTWNNLLFRQHIGHSPDGHNFKLATGTHTLDWLVEHCRSKCNVVLTQAA
jgi:hypothetical protein